MNYFGSIFAMVACIVMSAYFSATETAFSSLNKTRLRVLADNGNKRAALALKLSNDYDKLISTILIGNNIVNIMVASIGTLLFVGLYGDIGATVSTVVVTIVVLIFGEITPKSVAKDTPERFALFSAPFIRLWILVLTPLNFLFSQWKKLVSRFFKTDDNAKMSHEELLLFMEDVEQDGGIDENEGELLRNALEFRDLTAAEILTHRMDLEAVDANESHEISLKALPAPQFEGGEAVAVQQGAGMVVTAAKEEEVKASVEFLKWFIRAENNIAFSVGSGYLPVTRKANDMQEILASGLTLDDNMQQTLAVAVDTVNGNRLYTPHAFAGGSSARKVLEYGLRDLAAADRETVVQRIAEGQSAAEAEAEFLTDEYFEAWYQDICAKLAQYEG